MQTINQLQAKQALLFHKQNTPEVPVKVTFTKTDGTKREAIIDFVFPPIPPSDPLAAPKKPRAVNQDLLTWHEVGTENIRSLNFTRLISYEIAEDLFQVEQVEGLSLADQAEENAPV